MLNLKTGVEVTHTPGAHDSIIPSRNSQTYMYKPMWYVKKINKSQGYKTQ